MGEKQGKMVQEPDGNQTLSRALVSVCGPCAHRYQQDTMGLSKDISTGSEAGKHGCK